MGHTNHPDARHIDDRRSPRSSARTYLRQSYMLAGHHRICLLIMSRRVVQSKRMHQRVSHCPQLHGFLRVTTHVRASEILESLPHFSALQGACRTSVELGQEVDTSKEHHRCGKQPVVSLWMVGSFCFAQLEEL